MFKRLTVSSLASLILTFSAFSHAENKACLFEGTVLGKKSKECLQNTGAPQEKLWTICAAFGLRNILFGIEGSEMVACPAQPKGSCAGGAVGSGITHHFYELDDKELAKTKRECEAEGGKWTSNDEQSMLLGIGIRAMVFTKSRAQNFLRAGWPLGGSMLKPERVSFMGSGVSDDGYRVVTRLWYINAIGASQYIDIAFFYNKNGNETGIEFVDYSDALAKQYIPIRQLSRHELLNEIK